MWWDRHRKMLENPKILEKSGLSTVYRNMMFKINYLKDNFVQ